MDKQTFSFILIVIINFNFSYADEGMWIPKLIKEQEDKMKSLGMQITAEEIYNEKNESLKDAVVHFGGGCTAEIISSKGLILTNHHCGYSRIQSHSSLENNYLKNGFWAESLEKELPNPGLTVSRIVSMKNVTDQILEGIDSETSNEDKAKIINENIENVGEEAIKDSHYNFQVRPYYEGNQFYLILRETFKDIRFVGAPPSSVGKFGFDTDNWVWPRHTGDFSIFRIYANKENKPAEYAEDNVPYTPIKSLQISTKGVKPGDFTMVYGFPGTTYEYLYSKKLDLIINKALPLAIEMRQKNLEVIDEAIRNSEEVAIQYAAKQSRISNAYKKWIGQSKGLNRFDAVEKKKVLEEKFSNAVMKDKKLKKLYGDLFENMNASLIDYEKYYLAYTLYREFVYYGPEFVRFVNGIERTINSEDSLAAIKENLESRIDNFYKNYNTTIDQSIMEKSSMVFFENIDKSLLTENLSKITEKYKGEYNLLSQKLFGKSIFMNEMKIKEWANAYSGNTESIAEDPAFIFTSAFYDFYSKNIQSQYAAAGANLKELEKTYMTAQMKVLPDEKNYYPNANRTLRVSFGQISGYEPMDAIEYQYQTTAAGILEKYIPESYEYDVPAKLRELIRNKDFGDYAEGDQLPVCFIASNHTSGGNSGSPVFNGNGQLIGINFDRTWESTMSDMMFNPEICRNISVDMRYILFIIDKFAGAQRLIEEMDIN